MANGAKMSVAASVATSVATSVARRTKGLDERGFAAVSTSYSFLTYLAGT